MVEQKENGNFENDNPALTRAGSTSQESSTVKEPTPEAKPQIEKKSFFERWSNSRFWLVRGSYVVLRAVWTVVMVIGGFIAWLISLLFI
ncbi:hypothetical protein [Aequorivita vladivostokensis]|uniref:Uncharacterized protein n=1 Tax=Aequorivita vladivostokensis TaxID=171194 RepID=A0ABR5DHC1_9FLAO|nr:hypothetical protein [Aequorivita vladivostokensis]KJJ38164.1 hypothetical protein MB09_11145 [Aequorivita vladivostokensis]